MRKKVLAMRICVVGFAVFSFLFGFTWQKHGFCLGDDLMTSLGLPTWSNGISRTHYAAILAVIGLLIAFFLFTATASKNKAFKVISRRCNRMNKLTPLVLALVCVLGLAGCQKAIKGSEVYSFPEPTTLITGTYYSQGQETVFEIGHEDYDPNDLSTNSVITWFYDLELIACDKPEAVEGAESYDFYVKGENAFTYEDRGSEAYIIIDSTYYAVTNPSNPPIVKNTENEFVEFHGQLFDKSDLTEETLEWLDWYNSLPEDEQLSVSAIPSDLLEESGISATEDTEATNN